MTRQATAAEKIMAVAGTYKALVDELPSGLHVNDPFVEAALIDASTRIALATMTSDMGILAGPPEPADAGD